MEAAEEIARQLRLRDLAGLIVIDFIDMEEKRNNRAVERRLKDCLRADRARIQVGRISHFGLLEMSRQRIRTGVLESSVEPCPHCHGTGQVRSVSSLALQLLRALEEHLLRHATHHLRVLTRPDAALYILNQKRAHLYQLEQRFGLSIAIIARSPEHGQSFQIERGDPVTEPVERRRPIALHDMAANEADREDEAAEAEAEEEAEAIAHDGEEADERHEMNGREGGRRRRRRRGGRRGEGEMREAPAVEAAEEAEDEAETRADDERPAGGAEDDEQRRRRRRRGRRGGRRREQENGLAASGDFDRAEGAAPEGPGAEAETPIVGPEAGAGEEAPAVVMDEGEAPGEFAAAPTPLVQPSARTPLLPAEDGPAAEPGAATPAGAEDERPMPAAAAMADVEAALVAADEVLAETQPDDAAPDAGLTEVAADMPDMAARDGDEAAQPTPQVDGGVISSGAEAGQTSHGAPAAAAVVEDDRPKRTGWWSRRSFF